MGNSLKLEGFNELLEDLENMASKATDQGLDKALKAGGQVIEQAIQSRTPVKRGILKSSIRVSQAKGKGESRHVTIGSHKNTKGARHAHLVEFGHGGPHPAPPHPFVRPAFDASKEEAFEAMKNTIKNELKD
ncbi:MAG: hypothetical protein GX786_04890 [Clostridiales bacterium]|nr:hypothetical protein [Clostridiales bacterium]